MNEGPWPRSVAPHYTIQFARSPSTSSGVTPYHASHTTLHLGTPQTFRLNLSCTAFICTVHTASPLSCVLPTAGRLGWRLGGCCVVRRLHDSAVVRGVAKAPDHSQHQPNVSCGAAASAGRRRRAHAHKDTVQRHCGDVVIGEDERTSIIMWCDMLSIVFGFYCA